jgi:hypothetical protein
MMPPLEEECLIACILWSTTLPIEVLLCGPSPAANLGDVVDSLTGSAAEQEAGVVLLQEDHLLVGVEARAGLVAAAREFHVSDQSPGQARV